MRVLSFSEADSVGDRVLRELPRRLLESIATGPGRREHELSREVAGQMPGPGARERVPLLVGEALDWFVSHRELEKGYGGRYYCAPPYLIESARSDSTWLKLSLCGDPAGERLLRERFDRNSLRVHGETVMSSEELKEPIGVRRWCAFTGPPLSEIESRCKDAGITVIGLGDVAEAVPRISEVRVPSESEFGVEILVGGLWELYAPAREEGGKWNPDRFWRTRNSRLVRWRPSEDRRGEHEARVFYHSGNGRIAELGAESSRLWQLYLNSGVAAAASLWRDGGRLWVPRGLPSAALWFLEVLSETPPRRREAWSVFELGGGPADGACELLADRLELRIVEGSPPFKVNRRGR